MSQAASDITPGERRELRSVVRSQMKVLRGEIKQRRAALLAEGEVLLLEKYRHEDQRMNELRTRAQEVTDRANAMLSELLADYPDVMDAESARYSGKFHTPHLHPRGSDRSQFRDAMTRGVEMQVQQALSSIDRREADLLRELSLGALKSEGAVQFLESIPTASELVPGTLIREIETKFDEQHQEST